MLIEIMCEQFKNYNNPRGKIQFHKGLNIVMGDEMGSNSIGKSTFLMIIDFIFGGEDYVKKLSNVKEEVGDHVICFAFEFNNQVYYFSRSTNDFRRVYICDSNYDTLNNESLSLDQYLSFLQKNYKMCLPGLTFRNAVGRSMRIYKRETLDEEHPIHQAKQETAKSAIEGLLKLIDLFREIEEQSQIALDAKERYSSLKKAQKYQYIPIAKKKSDFEKNEMRIKELSKQANELIDKSSKGLLDLDSFQLEKISILKRKLSEFKRQKSRLLSKLENIRVDGDLTVKSSQQNYMSLLEFFPNVNLKHIEEIDNFHRQVSKVLKKEVTDAEENILSAVTLLNNNIQEIEDEIVKVGEETSLPKAVLDQYAVINMDLKRIKMENDNYIKMNELSDKYKEEELKLNNLIIEKMHAMQKRINDEMKRINDIIYDRKTTAPILEIKDASHYSFFTPKDDGTGTQYKGVIVFDLAMLQLTQLPVIAHDSVMLKHLQDKAIERILGLYVKSSKQIFIALDKKSSYTEGAQKIMDESVVIQLSSGAGALFGKAWNNIE